MPPHTRIPLPPNLSSRWCGVVDRRRGAAQVSSTLLDHGSKLRGPSPKSPRVAEQSAMLIFTHSHHQICRFLFRRRDECELHIFSPGEDLTRITLCDMFRLITEKNTPPFVCFSRLIFLASPYPFFPAKCSQRDAPDLKPNAKGSLCMTAVNCLPGNYSSRYSSKVTSKLRSRCSPLS
ncbi:hypothetical protein TNCV_4205751 [Trichonephila clavipes]|nr:hypothetical protein TNCV_4205751 [Trichonephila clavipes]